MRNLVKTVILGSALLGALALPDKIPYAQNYFDPTIIIYPVKQLDLRQVIANPFHPNGSDLYGFGSKSRRHKKNVPVKPYNETAPVENVPAKIYNETKPEKNRMQILKKGEESEKSNFRMYLSLGAIVICVGAFIYAVHCTTDLDQKEIRERESIRNREKFRIY